MKINTSLRTVEVSLLRSGRSKPAVSLVQDDVKEQESSAMWILIAGDCVIPFWNQWSPQNQESWDSHEKMIFFLIRASLRTHVRPPFIKLLVDMRGE